MKREFFVLLFGVVFCLSATAEPLVLTAAKDSFGRSNERSCNSGASSVLYLSESSNIRTLIAFDLSEITNKIESAVFRFQQQSSSDDPLVLTVAPMVQTKRNAAWKEGRGALGAKGQNASEGESCYGWSAFPDTPWEYDVDKTVVDLADKRLWKQPLISAKKTAWVADEWVEITVSDLALLEAIRESDNPVLTLGLWGTAGREYYAIHSKESGKAPELVLTLEVEEQKEGE